MLRRDATQTLIVQSAVGAVCLALPVLPSLMAWGMVPALLLLCVVPMAYAVCLLHTTPEMGVSASASKAHHKVSRPRTRAASLALSLGLFACVRVCLWLVGVHVSSSLGSVPSLSGHWVFRLVGTLLVWHCVTSLMQGALQTGRGVRASSRPRPSVMRAALGEGAVRGVVLSVVCLMVYRYDGTATDPTTNYVVIAQPSAANHNMGITGTSDIELYAGYVNPVDAEQADFVSLAGILELELDTAYDDLYIMIQSHSKVHL
ncbi:hypothetical protein KIPB_008813 [Kipferlia bialata]|uniref:Uncharacterized protein n=1 Tax=Kipferlia bialata TaxID=797122 RepID=A0A9K3D1B2_9EUKA|nr:hypothetical protein KIPB_008813 [Kipferlia bialata]|eukprot:g8813.t1